MLSLSLSLSLSLFLPPPGTPLVDAIREGHGKTALLLRKLGGELRYTEAKASSELCELARKGDLIGIKLLLESGCSPDAIDYDRRTCLHLAASEGNALIAEALVLAGAEINPVDRWHGTPLYDAVREGHHQVATLLHQLGGDLKFDEAKASSELCERARTGDLERIKMLLDCGCSPDAADYDRRTSLHVAASEGNMTIVGELLRRVHDVSPKDRWGGLFPDSNREISKCLQSILTPPFALSLSLFLSLCLRQERHWPTRCARAILAS